MAAMLPITLLQVLVLAIFFRKTSPTPGLEAAGLISAVIGLVLFLDGLRVAVMPMAMLVGEQLPKRLALPWVLLVAFFLGVVVTYAEPAIAAIRPLAALVDPESAPYLYYMMNQQQEIMVFSIGAGVGVAAVMGTLKFLYDVSLKLLIAGSLLPTVAAACYMHWGNPALRPLIGLAFDCGAVTTGPVTVPVLLALGVGVMQAQKQKRLARAALEDAAINRSEGNTLEGFGIVTLASLMPILAVELMAIITSLVHPHSFVLEQAQRSAAQAKGVALPVVERSPLKEVVYGVRAISPLIASLVLLVVVVLRQPLPSKGFLPGDDEGEEGRGGGGACDGGGAGAAGEGGGGGVKRDLEQPVSPRAAAAAAPRPAARPAPPVTRPPSLVTAVIAASGQQDIDYYELALTDGASSSRTGTLDGSGWSGGGLGDVKVRVSEVAGSCLACAGRYSALIAAMLMCQVGMILFNLGLTYGFAALGDKTGVTLPSAFLKVDYEPGSPYFSPAGGITLTMATIFLLGVLATKAEPALNVLGETVETLSSGKFTKKMLIWAVCAGVAVGMCAGAAKILFGLSLIYFILFKYFAACGLTVIARESITAVAWDSAGVTTGPVTVPFVLAIGIGFSKAVGAPEGFGMLTIMSVAPIISVLFVSLVKKPVQQAAKELARISKMSLQTVSKTLRTISSRGGDDRVVDFAAQLMDNPSLMADAKVSVTQLEQLARRNTALRPIMEHGSASAGATAASGSASASAPPAAGGDASLARGSARS